MIQNNIKKNFALLLMAVITTFFSTGINADKFGSKEKQMTRSAPKKKAAKSRAFNYLALDTDLLTANLGEIWRSTTPERNRSTLHTISHLRILNRDRGSSAQVFGNIATERKRIFNDTLSLNLLDTFLRNDALNEELGKITTFEETFGVMFDFYKQINKFGFTVEVPIYGCMAHIYAPYSTRTEIPKLMGDGDSVFSHSEKERLNDALTKISRDFGIGDARVGLSYTFDSPNRDAQLTLGALGIIPVEALIKEQNKQLLFDPIKTNFNPTPLDIYLDPSLGFQYLMHLIEMLQHVNQTPKIGDGAWGAGAKCGLRADLTPRLSIATGIEYYHLFPQISHRLFMRYRKSNPTELETEPGEYKTKTAIGDIVRGHVFIEKKITGRSYFGVGVDLYTQKTEKFQQIFTESNDLDKLVLGESNMKKTEQVKAITYYKKDLCFKNYNGSFDINLGIPISSIEIGKSWHIAAQLSVYY